MIARVSRDWSPFFMQWSVVWSALWSVVWSALWSVVLDQSKNLGQSE